MFPAHPGASNHHTLSSRPRQARLIRQPATGGGLYSCQLGQFSWRLGESLSQSLLSHSALTGTKEDAPHQRGGPSSPLLTGPDHMSTAFMDLTFSEIQFSHSVVSDSAIPWTAACQTSLSITNSWSLLKLMSIALVMPFNNLILCRPLPYLPLICSGIRVFSSESVLCIKCPKYWSLSFSISPSNEYSGLISI